MIIKTLSTCAVVLGGAFFLDESPQDKPAAQPANQEFRIDGVHSSVIFRVKHLRAGIFYGRFNQLSGSFKIDAGNLGASFIRCEIDAESVDSNSERRDRHLKSQDFFNVKEHPKITFESKKIEKAGDDVYKVTGDLTMRGVTKSVEARVEHTGTANMNPRFGLRSGYEAIFTVKRTEFGMDFMAKDDALSDEVRIMVGVEGMVANDGGRRR